VRAYLGSKQVESGRMFIIAPKMDANRIKDQGNTTRVDLSLEWRAHSMEAGVDEHIMGTLQRL